MDFLHLHRSLITSLIILWVCFVVVFIMCDHSVKTLRKYTQLQGFMFISVNPKL